MQTANIQNRESYLRKMALSGYVIRLDLSEISTINRLLRGVSNNLNQIAKRVNQTGALYQEDLTDLQQQYDCLWEQAEQIIRGLSNLQH